MQDTIIPSDLGSPTGNEKNYKREQKQRRKERTAKGAYFHTQVWVRRKKEIWSDIQTGERQRQFHLNSLQVEEEYSDHWIGALALKSHRAFCIFNVILTDKGKFKSFNHTDMRKRFGAIDHSDIKHTHMQMLTSIRIYRTACDPVNIM